MPRVNINGDFWLDVTPEQLDSIQAIRKLTSAEKLVLTGFEFGVVSLTAAPIVKQQKTIAAAPSTVSQSSGPPTPVTTPKNQQPLLDGLEEEEAPPDPKPPEIKPCGQLDQPTKRTYRKHRRYKRSRQIQTPMPDDSLARHLTRSLMGTSVDDPGYATAVGTAAVLMDMAERDGDVLLLDIWQRLGHTTVETETGWAQGIGQRLRTIWRIYKLDGKPECRATTKGGFRKPYYTITPKAREQLRAQVTRV